MCWLSALVVCRCVQQTAVTSSQRSSVCFKRSTWWVSSFVLLSAGQLWPKHVSATQVFRWSCGRDCCLTHGWHNTVSDGGYSSSTHTHTLTHTYVAERLQHTTFLIPNPPPQLPDSTHSYLFAFLSFFFVYFNSCHSFTLFPTSPPVWCLYVSLLSDLSLRLSLLPPTLHSLPFFLFCPLRLICHTCVS